MEQDFSKKVAIVVREDLPNWQVLNTIAHASAYLGNKMGAEFGTGENFLTNDGLGHPRNSQYAIIVFSAKPGQMQGLIERVRESQLPYIGFIREMIEMTDDVEIENILSSKNDSEVEYLGIGIFGDKEVISGLTKKFSLWK